MTFTSDERRRRAVAELRKASTGAYRHVDVLDVIANSIGVDIAGKFDYEVEKEIYAALADFIDRPTATASMDYEAMEDGVPDCRIWTCHRCNESFPVYRGFIPAYCQNCGAEVVDA